MRLIVDGVFYQLAETGIARVWTSILERLVQRDLIEVVLLDRGGAPAISGVRRVPFPAYRDRYSADDSILLQKICDHLEADAFSSTYYTSVTATPMTLVVYDMIPEKFEFDLTQRMWREKEIAISFARSFVAISQNTKRDLLAFYPELDVADVRVAHPGVDHRVFFRRPQQDIDRFRATAGFARPYVLLVGSREQHKGYKNTKLLFDALATGDGMLDVLCVGGEPEVEATWLDAVPAGTKVERLKLDDEALSCAYGGATALVYPSLYEGFGLPVVEAMASGCPVITTGFGSLPEVTGGEACLEIDGVSLQEMVCALKHVSEPETRERLVTAGLRQAATFSWDVLAEAIEEQVAVVAERARDGHYASFFETWRHLRDLQSSVDVDLIF